MSVRRTSARRDSMKSVAVMVAALARRDDPNAYSVTIEFALTELARDEMRAIAQREMRYLDDAAGLLRSAISDVIENVKSMCEGLDAGGKPIDLDKYVAKVREKLRFPAKEIQELANKLIESRTAERLRQKQDVTVSSGLSFILHDLGFREAVQGLLAEPSENNQKLNIDTLRHRREWRLEGDWFPYELRIEDFVFVIDDDGSIFVSTVNLPDELRARAARLIREIAEAFFT